jgi:hypothetical protein|tara:strand:+ start:82 stop:240 length:159 start_codon:yes stop_codon:yes gene_type:complete
MTKQELANKMKSITHGYDIGVLSPNEYIGQIRWEIEFYDLYTNDKEKLETFK